MITPAAFRKVRRSPIRAAKGVIKIGLEFIMILTSIDVL
jgi:hypothetical protein